jgi:hypothetical protein
MSERPATGQSGRAERGVYAASPAKATGAQEFLMLLGNVTGETAQTPRSRVAAPPRIG